MSLFGKIWSTLKTVGHDAEVGVKTVDGVANNPWVTAAMSFFPPTSGAAAILKIVNRYTGMANEAVGFIEAQHESLGKTKSGAEKRAWAIDTAFGALIETKKLEAEAKGRGLRYNVDLPGQIVDHTSAAATLTADLFASFEEFDPATGTAIPPTVAAPTQS